ncbi:hypothetical protein TorRG33x02_118690 [Trema orientale]|uniref:Uncharacterized protein n=1 Tax=Trema orientale TaxID=63057 RepID=A0A2P5F3K4_TREOI|nr:hypothetical protein TorRG33x02_118690 [Trema orientale]
MRPRGRRSVPKTRTRSSKKIGSYFARSSGEIAELNSGVPRLTSYLSFSPPALLIRGRDEGPTEEEGDPITKKSKSAPFSNSDDDTILTIMRSKRSTNGGPSEHTSQDKTEKLQMDRPSTEATETARDAEKEMAIEASASDKTTPLITPTSYFKSEKGPATKFEPEVFSLKNMDSVTSRSITQLTAIQSFYSSHIEKLTQQINADAVVAKWSEAFFNVLKADFEIYRKLEKAKARTAVAHTLSTERTKTEVLAANLTEAEGRIKSFEAEVPSLHSKAELANLAQVEAKLKEQEFQNVVAEIRLAFIIHNRAGGEGNEAKKPEVKAKLETHSLQHRLDPSNEVTLDLHSDYHKLMKAHIELTLRLADGKKLKIRYLRKVNILSAESYKFVLENREFDGHMEVVMPDQFDEQKGIERDHYSVGYYMQKLRDEINIVYPTDVLRMLDEENNGPSTSAPIGREIILVSDLPE